MSQFECYSQHAFFARRGIWASRALRRVFCDAIIARLARFLLKSVSRRAASDCSVSMSLFRPHFAAKHAIHKNEVPESEAHPQSPPNEPHS